MVEEGGGRNHLPLTTRILVIREGCMYKYIHMCIYIYIYVFLMKTVSLKIYVPHICRSDHILSISLT